MQATPWRVLVWLSQDGLTLLVRSQTPSLEALESYLLGHLPGVLHETVVCLLACVDSGDLSNEAARLEACRVDSEAGHLWGGLLVGTAESSLVGRG